MASDLEAEMNPIWATGFPFSKSGTGFVDIKDKAYYTFNLSRTTQDFPKIFTSLRYGSDQVRWDVSCPLSGAFDHKKWQKVWIEPE